MVHYLSVCSGIEAATVAWHPLGWIPVGFSEIEKFPSAVLEHHYPDVPNFGDFTRIEADAVGPIDLLVGGTPCQSFSVAGLRGGLDDDRGNLALEFCRLAQRTRPRWIVWENVPGVLSMDEGRAFASILGGLAECGYGLAYRVLDAQFVRTQSHPRAVPQRRRRVFVVGHSGGDWQRAAAVLFERESMRWDSPPSRKPGKDVAADVVPSLTASGRGVERCGESRGQDPVVAVAHTLRGEAFAASEDGPVAIQERAVSDNPDAGPDGVGVRTDGAAYTLEARTVPQAVALPWAVRRLIPEECEKLQGFKPGYTQVPYRGKPAADGPRYKALGNSMAVNVMRWIGERIQIIEGQL
jgi:DNA (cytosine-5)-methyltransferase 1